MKATGTSQVLGPGEGEVVRVGGNRLVIKAATPRQLVCDYTAPAGFPGPPLHVHAFDETYLVLEGQLTVRLSTDVFELGPGSSVHVDADVPHTFSNPSPEPVRFLVVCSPGGFDEYFRAVAAGDHEAIEEVSRRLGYSAAD